MRKIILPLTIFILGLFVAKQFFGVDIEDLAEGYVKFLSDLFKGPG